MKMALLACLGILVKLVFKVCPVHLVIREKLVIMASLVHLVLLENLVNLYVHFKSYVFYNFVIFIFIF